MTGSCQGQVSGGVGTRLQGKARTCLLSSVCLHELCLVFTSSPPLAYWLLSSL